MPTRRTPAGGQVRAGRRLGWVSNASRADEASGWCVNRSHKIAPNGAIVQSPAPGYPGPRRRAAGCLTASAHLPPPYGPMPSGPLADVLTDLVHPPLDRYACHVYPYRPDIVQR